MKTIKHLFATLLLLCATAATAHDFEAGGIYYKITDATNNTVAVTYKGTYYYTSNEYTGSVVIPEFVTYEGVSYCVTSIGYGAFWDCTGLTSVVIGNSITSIGENVFINCSGLTSVKIPNSVTIIGGSAFRNCTGLTSIEIPNSVTSIGKFAFGDCSGLTSVEIPNSVTSIGSAAFDDCTGLTSIVIPNSVTSIGTYAFMGCSGLTSVVIPNSVTSIGMQAFNYCSGLTSIVIPNSVTSIGDKAFEGCKGLKTVVNLSNLTFSKGSNNNGYVAYYADKVYNAPNASIEGDYVFGKPTGVNTLVCYLGNAIILTLPADYKGENYVIGNEAFKNNEALTGVTVPDGVTSIGKEAFYGCTSLNDLKIGKRIVSIDEYAFYGCSSLENLKIGDGVKSIEKYAFHGCDNLKNIVLGKRVNYIGDYAFATSNKIETIYALPTRAINCENTTTAFHQNAYKYATLYVRESSIDSYETTEPWSKFYIEPIGNFTLTYMVDGEVYKKEKYEYDSAITPLALPEKEGHTFSGWSEIPETMPAEDITVTGSFSVNSYNVTFVVDEEVYKTVSVNYGETIPMPEEPVKDGCTFSGWSEIPATMPAEDITITGSFYANYYTLTYMVDGEVYATVTVGYNAVIPEMEEPTKEGHTFSGWENVPETMPAQDITIIGSFTVNSYNAIFLVDNALYAMLSVNYGEAIELPEPPSKEGFVFDGWDGLPVTMPAKDIVLIAIFTDVTGVDDVKSEIGKVKTIYDLNGRAVENPTNGIYVVNGKKVLIK
ncbi:MAG: leucine-rich repeat protein [Bacteroidaceae bacterium]|nr:leucine-rich repeat protein [Bacteroidaceae bacterium]